MNPSLDDALLALALTKPASDREAWLLFECAGDHALFTRILLRMADQARIQAGRPTEVDPGSVAMGSESATTSVDRMVGMVLGRYTLTGKLGEGGCGVVYSADQTDPIRRRVALKVIKLGMDTTAVVARFHAERQALAMMDHPNIARVFDAGATEGGRPYFVMELVTGCHITEFCDSARMAAKLRIELFIQVCHAIQHAHQKGVLHRDIKPSNILVSSQDGVPLPKVIDFGIAKAIEGRLAESVAITQAHQFIGTPAYVSPEQAALGGTDIDTRSDIYSLGVLLYELLTGRTPFDPEVLARAGVEGMRRILTETEPLRPSTRLAALPESQRNSTAQVRSTHPAHLVANLEGDLDWIVMKCLEKDRNRRYQTVGELAADLGRHLNNVPVLARPPNWRDRATKSYRRHRVLFLATTAVVAVLLIGVVGSTWQAIRATQAEREARASENRAIDLLYAADMLAAQQALQAGRLGRARSLLDAHLPRPGQRDRRGFEWYLVQHGAKGQHADVLLEQTNRIRTVTASADGRTLAYIDPLEIKIFDMNRRQLVQRWPSPAPRISVFTLSPDGRYLGVGAPDRLIIYDATQPGGRWTQLSSNRYEVLAFAPNRPWLAATRRFQPADPDPMRLDIWDYQRGEMVFTFTNATGPLVWWEKGSTILAGLHQEGRIQRWDTATGKMSESLRSPPQWNGNYALLATIAGTRNRGVAFVGKGLTWFDPRNGQTLSEWPEWDGSLLTPIALSADGNTFATAEDALIKWQVFEAGNRPEILAGHVGDVTGICFLGSSSNLVSSGSDGRLLLWQPASNRRVRFNFQTNSWNALNTDFAVSPDRHYCAAKGGLWELSSGSLYRGLTGSFLSFSPDGGRYATLEGEKVRVWSIETNGPPPVDHLLPPGGPYLAGDLSPDGRYFVGINRDFKLVVCDIRSSKVLVDGALRLGSRSGDFLWVQFVFSQHRVALTGDGSSAIWDWEDPTDRCLTELPGRILAKSGDDQWVALGSEDGLVLGVMRLGAASELIRLEGHVKRVTCAAFSEDGSTVASLDVGGELRLWRMPSGQLVGVLPRRVTGFTDVAFSADSQCLYLSDTEGIEILEAPRLTNPNAAAASSPMPLAKLPATSIWRSGTDSPGLPP